MNTKEFLESLLNEYAPKDKNIEKIIAIISDEEKIGGDYKSLPISKPFHMTIKWWGSLFL
mgnify:CR=1 FL=1